MSETNRSAAPPGGNASSGSPPLERTLGPWAATSLNVANMIGIGPFITIPLFLGKMGGPQALVAWIAAAILVLCDGLVWSELGAALPGSGGSYHFLREIYGRFRWGRIVPFLFVWQFLVSGTLELASGFTGFMQYVDYAYPALEDWLTEHRVPGGKQTLCAICALIVAGLLCQTTRSAGWAGILLAGASLLTAGIVIVAGLLNFDSSLIQFPEGAFHLDGKFAAGLGGAMLIAIYDYFGYYNICHLGEEVRDPGRTIPRAVVISILLVAAVYLVMNTCIIAVVPVDEAIDSSAIALLFMERLYGRTMMLAFLYLVACTVAACVFVMMFGYSRIPLAAARQGDFFPAFAWLHPVKRYPWVSIAAIGIGTAALCYTSLDTLIGAAVTVRIAVQFIGQIIGLHLLRTMRPETPLPFRMKLYPLPSLVALFGWLFVFGAAESQTKLWAGGVLVSGIAAYLMIAAWRTRAASRPRQDRKQS